MLKEFDKTIVKLAKSYNIPPLESDDIAQELRLALWLKRDQYTPELGEYDSWAYIVCRNKIRDLARYYKRKKREEVKKISLDLLQGRGFDPEG
jgi:RNA polymerase sigma factor (sigma-70 family)